MKCHRGLRDHFNSSQHLPCVNDTDVRSVHSWESQWITERLETHHKFIFYKPQLPAFLGENESNYYTVLYQESLVNEYIHELLKGIWMIWPKYLNYHSRGKTTIPICISHGKSTVLVKKNFWDGPWKRTHYFRRGKSVSYAWLSLTTKHRQLISTHLASHGCMSRLNNDAHGDWGFSLKSVRSVSLKF